MRNSRKSLLLGLLAVIFFIGAYLASLKSFRDETERQQQEAAQSGFWMSEQEHELNYWDACAVGSLVLGASLTIVAIWVRKL